MHLKVHFLLQIPQIHKFSQSKKCDKLLTFKVLKLCLVGFWKRWWKSWGTFHEFPFAHMFFFRQTRDVVILNATCALMFLAQNLGHDVFRIFRHNLRFRNRFFHHHSANFFDDYTCEICKSWQTQFLEQSVNQRSRSDSSINKDTQIKGQRMDDLKIQDWRLLPKLVGNRTFRTLWPILCRASTVFKQSQLVVVAQ